MYAEAEKIVTEVLQVFYESKGWQEICSIAKACKDSLKKQKVFVYYLALLIRYLGHDETLTSLMSDMFFFQDYFTIKSLRQDNFFRKW